MRLKGARKLICDSATHIEERITLRVTEERSVTFGAALPTPIMAPSRDPGE